MEYNYEFMEPAKQEEVKEPETLELPFGDVTPEEEDEDDDEDHDYDEDEDEDDDLEDAVDELPADEEVKEEDVK